MEKEGKQPVSKAEYARMRGWDRSYLSKKSVVAKLAPALVDDGQGRMLVDVEKANAIFKIDTDTAKVRKPAVATVLPEQAGVDEEPELTPGSMDAHRRENIRLKNEELALKVAEQKGLTLPRAGVFGAAAQAGQSIRENIFALIPGLAERFASMTDAREIRTVMDSALRGCLESVSNDFMRRIQSAGGGEGQPVAH